MPKTRQVIRKVDRRTLADFDEQLWPINCALLVLAGFIAGVIIAKSDFQAAVVWQNGWFRLGLLAVSLVALIGGTFYLHRKKAIRRMQLAVLLSLLVNLGIEFWLYQTYMYLAAQEDETEASDWIEEERMITLPDYGRQPTEQMAVEEVFERPVETVTPDNQPQQVTRQETANQATSAAMQSTQTAATATQQPAPAAIERAQSSSVPRRANERSGEQLSRQTMQAPNQPSQAVPVAEAAATAPANNPQVEAQVTQTRQQAANIDAQRQPTADETARLPQPQQMTVERRTQDQQSPTVAPSATAVSRQAAQLAQPSAQAEVAQSQPVTAPTQTQTAATPQPNATLTPPRLATSTPQVNAAASTPATSTSAAANPNAATAQAQRASQSAEAPALATNAASAPSRTTAAATAANASGAAEAIENAPVAQSSPSANRVDATGVSAARAAAATTGSAGAAATQSVATDLPASVAPQGPSGRAAGANEPASAASPQPQQIGRTATTLSPSGAASAEAATQAPMVAEAGGAPTASASSQASTVARAAGAVQLPRTSTGPGQPVAGESLNSATGSAAQPQRAATSSDQSLASRSPGTGTVERSQGMASPLTPATAIPLAGNAPAAGSLANQASNQPQAAMTGVARASGNVATTAAAQPSGGQGPSGAGVNASSVAAAPLSRAGGGEPAAPGAGSPAAGPMAARSASAGPAASGQAEAIAGEPGIVSPSSLASGPPAPQAAGEVRRAASGGAVAAAPGPQSSASGGSPSLAPSAASGISRSRGTEGSPAIASTGTTSDGPARSAAAASVPSAAAMADELGPVAGTSQPSELAGGQGPAVDGPTRQASGAVQVQVAALEGVGGLAENQPTLEVGIRNRKANPESDFINAVAHRFRTERSGSLPNVDGRAMAPAFSQRSAENRPEAARSRGGTAGSEKAVEMGLDYLAKQQMADGRWSLQRTAVGASTADNVGSGQMQADSAATGLALLCFLGAGYTHTDGKYRDTVAAGLAHLVGNQKADGDLFSSGSKYVWFYSHGIASIALCEAYGMTRDPALREPAQKALDFIIASQHPVEGGWRYAPQTGTDTSVSGWQVMALKSGELAGLRVPQETYERAVRWLDTAQAEGNPSLYRYRPASDHPHQRDPSPTMTAEGLLMRLYTGTDRRGPLVLRGADYLKQHLPSVGTRTQPERDAYYWYYATQVMFQVGGDHWTAWNERLRALLISSQAQTGPLAGSWDPRGAVSDRWGLEAGRLYVTAMHLLMLEVYYRHLPLYQTP